MRTRYSLHDVDGWRSFLHTNGYAVIANVLTPTQVSSAMTRIWDIFESLGSVKRDDPKTWVTAKMWPPMLHGGMIQYIGHAPVQWTLREQCAPVFAQYYNIPVHDLATSFDGMCLMTGQRRYRRRGDLISFLHTDQSPRRKGEWSIQGLINLADAGPEDGGLVVVPGSHREHEAFFNGHPRQDQKGDWYKFSAQEQEAYRDRAVKVCAEPGDFLLWDSRTFHCNAVPERQDALRVCTYICQLPKTRLSSVIRAKRQQAFEEKRTSTHHPAEGFRLFPTLPRFVTDRDRFLQKVRAVQNLDQITPIQRALVQGTDQNNQQTLV